MDLIPTTYETTFNELASQLIPDKAFLDTDGNPVELSVMEKVLERERVFNGRWESWPSDDEPYPQVRIAEALNRIAEEISSKCNMRLLRAYTSELSIPIEYRERIQDRKWSPDLVVAPIPTAMHEGEDEEEMKSERDLESEESERDEEKYQDGDVDNGGLEKSNSEGENWPVEKSVPEGEPEIQSYAWTTFMAFGEVRWSIDVEDIDLIPSLAENVHEAFSIQDSRIWMISFGFIKDNFIVYLFDRSGVVKTKRINIHEQKKEFLRMAIGVLFVDEIYLGCDPTIKKRGGHWYLTVEQPDRTPAELEIIEMIFRREGIRCKGTTVWLVQGRIMSGEDEEGTVEESYIVKDSWVNENNLVKEYMVMEKLKSFSNTSQLVLHEEMDGGTKTFRQGGSLLIHEMKKRGKTGDYEISNRKHHRTVVSTIGKPIGAFESLDELVTAFLNIFLTIIDLYTEKQILHRDISQRNIILVDTDEKTDGCLIDFEFAVDTKDEKTVNLLNKPLGTISFIANEVLASYSDFQHNYYHDLESAFYVLLWVCLEKSYLHFVTCPPINKNGAKRRSKQDYITLFETWKAGNTDLHSLRNVAHARYHCISDEGLFKSRILDILIPEFDGIKDYLCALRSFFFPPLPDEAQGKSEEKEVNLCSLFKSRLAGQDPAVVREEIIKIHAESFFQKDDTRHYTAEIRKQRGSDSAFNLDSISRQDEDTLVDLDERLSNVAVSKPFSSLITNTTDSIRDQCSDDSSPTLTPTSDSQGEKSIAEQMFVTSSISTPQNVAVRSSPKAGMKRRQRTSGGSSNFNFGEPKKQRGKSSGGCY